MKTLMGNQVDDIVTRFSYVGDLLHFKVLLEVKSGESPIVYANFDDYTNYKKAYRKLLSARMNNDKIIIPTTVRQAIIPPHGQRAGS